MTTHEQTIELIPEYARGSLSPVERDHVEAHLPQCEECRALLDACHSLTDELGVSEASELAVHPSSSELALFAVSPTLLPSETRKRIDSHILTCDVCVGDLRHTDGLDREVTYEEITPSKASSASMGGFATRVRRLFAQPMILVPVAFAVLALVAIPVLRKQSEVIAPASSSAGDTELVVALAEQTRGGLSRQVISITPELKTVKLEMRFVPESDRSYSISVASDAGRLVEQRRLAPAQAVQGKAAFRLISSALPDGNYTAEVTSVSSQGDTLSVFYPFTIKR